MDLIRQCTRNMNAVKWSDKERQQLARLGTMRILSLKTKLAKINPGFGYWIPMDKVRDAQSKQIRWSLLMRYKELGGYSRDTEHWLTGSAFLKNKTNDVDELRAHYRCEGGFHGFAANRFVKVERTA